MKGKERGGFERMGTKREKEKSRDDGKGMERKGKGRWSG